MHKNCCHQSYSLWLRYATNRFSAAALPQTPLGELIEAPPDPLAGLGAGDPGEREGERGGRKGGGGEVAEEKGREGSPGIPKSRVGKPSWSPALYEQ